MVELYYIEDNPDIAGTVKEYLEKRVLASQYARRLHRRGRI